MKSSWWELDYLQCCLGIQFENPEDGEWFSDKIRSEVECDIGAKISEGLSQKQLYEFDSIRDQIKAGLWLEKNRPDYRQVVTDVIYEWKKKVTKAYGQIPGTVTDEITLFKNCPVDFLNLPTWVLSSLDAAIPGGILTVGETVYFARREMNDRELEEIVVKKADAFADSKFRLELEAVTYMM